MFLTVCSCEDVNLFGKYTIIPYIQKLKTQATQFVTSCLINLNGKVKLMKINEISLAWLLSSAPYDGKLEFICSKRLLQFPLSFSCRVIYKNY